MNSASESPWRIAECAAGRQNSSAHLWWDPWKVHKQKRPKQRLSTVSMATRQPCRAPDTQDGKWLSGPRLDNAISLAKRRIVFPWYIWLVAPVPRGTTARSA